MSKTSDLHLHTLVSDGENTPTEMLAAAGEAGLKRVSFTDHDALGAYRHFGDIFTHARGLGIDLVAGIELDTVYQGREVHLLGYGFNLDDGGLNAHLESTRGLRRERVTRQIELINRHFGRKVVDPARVLIPNRDTLMKPHLVHAMLDLKLFAEYREAAHWVSENARVDVIVPKLPIADAIRLLRKAGGDAVLAHPGYLVREMEIPLESLLKELIPFGLSGIEVEYPYQGTSPVFPNLVAQRAMIDDLHALAKRFKLKETQGSDAHDTEALKKFAGTFPVEELKG
jgi:hypothetical protein